MENFLGNKSAAAQSRLFVCLALITGAPAFDGCSRKPAPQAAPPNAPVAESSAATAVQPDMNAVLGQLTQALRKFSFEHRHAPGSFSEFVAAASLEPIPTAPAGKKFAIDPKAVQVILVNQ